jgi:glycosyltransferase involved in cell wall biosynthesis
VKRILFISPGPVVHQKSNEKLKMLSEYFSGTILTSSARTNIINRKHIHNFDFHCMKFNRKIHALSRLKFIFYVLIFCFKCRLKKEKYDLITTYDPLISGLTGMLGAGILGTKFAPEVNGVFTSPAEYMDEKDNPLTPVKKILYIFVEGQVLKRADGIKVLFPNQLDYFGKKVEGKKIHCFSNLVEIEMFLDCTAKEQKKEILFVGFPFYRKGVDIIIDAFKLISEDYPDWRLKILGWFPRTEVLMKHIGGHPKIDYVPPVEHSEMPAHIGSCAIFVLPSRSEAMGRILIETMAAGKPRIGSNVDGIPTVIHDGIDGLLFENENVSDLADKLRRLINDGSLRKSLGDAGRQRALKQFTRDVYVENLRHFFLDVIGS